MEERDIAREETQFTLLQLHQVQEELERYYLESRSTEEIATAQQDQLLRAKALVARLLPETSEQAPTQNFAVEVLPASSPENVLQKEALLSSYAESLRRASALLRRALQS